MARKVIRRTSSSGGGALGIQYIGKRWALDELAMSEDIRHVAGSSAGAMDATFLALGMSVKDYRTLFLKTNIKKLLGEKIPLRSDSQKNVVRGVTRKGGPILRMIREGNAISLSWMKDPDIEKVTRENPDIKPGLRERIFNGTITFRDLAALEKVYPDRFKALTMLAVRHPDGKVQIFNELETPDVEIALAARASSSLPIILAPVEIEINGETSLFMDGGYFENLPLNYYDKENGKYVKNKMPKETLAFSFADLPKEDEFSALESDIANFLTEDLIEEIYAKLKDTQDLSRENLKKLFKENILETIKIDDEKSDEISGKIADRIVELLNGKKFKKEMQEFKKNNPGIDKKEISEKTKEFLLDNFIPNMYQGGFIEVLKRDILVSALVGLSAPYKNTEKKGETLKTLQKEYPENTVVLKTNKLKSTHFDTAEKYGRVFSACGYLGVMLHGIEGEYYNAEKFNPDRFFQESFDYFDAVYEALTADIPVEKNKLLSRINDIKNEKEPELKKDKIKKFMSDLKEYIRDNPNSKEAFALSRALEYRAGFISKNALLREIYEESFKQRGVFAVSNLSTKLIYTRSQLNKFLNNSENMMEVLMKHQGGERSKKILSAINKLDGKSKTIAKEIKEEINKIRTKDNMQEDSLERDVHNSSIR